MGLAAVPVDAHLTSANCSKMKASYASKVKQETGVIGPTISRSKTLNKALYNGVTS